MAISQQRVIVPMQQRLSAPNLYIVHSYFSVCSAVYGRRCIFALYNGLM